jgi:protein-S-isoprenylcysteine O-methyltransferase Ste14
MYVSELGLWLGWAVWYGSVGVLIGFAIALIVLTAAAQYEEGVLDARFGDAFRAYRSTVPRWFGARGHQEPRSNRSNSDERSGL